MCVQGAKEKWLIIEKDRFAYELRSQRKQERKQSQGM